MAEDPPMDSRNQRISSIDFFKVPAILAVIVIHTIPFGNQRYGEFIHQLAMVFFNQASRFAVPFFFIISGYLFGKKILPRPEDAGGLCLRQSLRLIVIFVFWTVFYLLSPADLLLYGGYGVSNILGPRVESIMEYPFTFVLEGSKNHLWFLTALPIALIILTILLSLKLEKALLPFSIILYIWGLLAGAYAPTPAGFEMPWFDAPFNTRNGPFFSMLFVAIGWHLSKGNRGVKASTALVIAVAGLVIHLIEAAVLWLVFHTDPMKINYVVGTVPMAAGIVLFLLAKKDLGKGSFITGLGKYTLGIYVSHYLFVDLFESAWTMLPVSMWDIWEFVFPFITFGCSLILTWVFIKTRILKPFVV